MKKTMIYMFWIISVILFVLFGGYIINESVTNEVERAKIRNKDGWQTCDEEVYLHYGEEEERFDLYWFNRIDYKTVPNGIDLIFYEEDGGDIFDVVVRGQYTFLCATDRDEVE